MLHFISLKLEKLLKVTDGVEHKAADINSANVNTVQIHCKTQNQSTVYEFQILDVKCETKLAIFNYVQITIYTEQTLNT